MLVELLDSLAAQTWPMFEIILVDDGSTDDTANLLTRWRGAHPTVDLTVLRQPNAGPAAARNRGFELAQGEFIFFIDSDDLVCPAALTDLVLSLQQSGKPYCLGTILVTDIAGVAMIKQDNSRPRQDAANILRSAWMTHAALYRRETVTHAGAFNAALRIGEDSEFQWRVVAKCGLGQVIATVVGLRREHGMGHLSVGRHDSQIYRDSIVAIQTFSGWLQDNLLATPELDRTLARRLTVTGLRLGYLGDHRAKAAAFAMAASLPGAPPMTALVAKWLGKINSDAFFSPIKYVVWSYRQLRKLRFAIDWLTLPGLRRLSDEQPDRSLSMRLADARQR